MRAGVVLVMLAAACLAGGAAAQDSVGDVRVLVIRATWGPTRDDAATLEQAAPFYERSSFGKLRLRLDITPWLRVYGGPVCPGDQEAAKTAAAAAGYDLPSYGRIVVDLPADVCNFGGVARGTEVLLTDPAVIVHELGHTFGLAHATAYQDDYGDPFSPMGHGTLDFSAYEKFELGWISSVQRATTSRTYGVADIDTASASPQALVVPTYAGEYWIERRGDLPRRVIVRRVKARSFYVGDPNDRFVAPHVFSVTRGFAFKWLDRKRPTQPHVHRLGNTVWWSPSDDFDSGVATYRVRFDGKLLAATERTRLTLPALRGMHRVGVIAVDRAGNRSRPSVRLLHMG